MKRKLFSIIICLCCMIFTLSGCSLFQMDLKAYYETPIAKVNGEVVEKEELIKDISSYYATYVQQYGMSPEEAFEKCLDSTINRTIILQEAKKQEEEGKLKFDQWEKNELWRKTFKSLNANLKAFEDEILGTKEPAKEEEKENPRKYTPYEPTAKVVVNRVEKDGQVSYEYKIVLTKEEEKHEVETVELSAKDFVVESDASESIQKEAKSKYIKQLKKNEEGRKLSTKDDEVWSREVDRIYKEYKNSAYITKLFELHEVEYVPSVRDVLDEYLRRVKKSYERYQEDSSLFTADLNSNATGIYYVPQDAETYFYVSHVLLGYSQDALAEMNELKTKLLENSISQKVYDNEIARIQNELKVVEYDKDGNKVEGQKTVKQVLAELNIAMKNAEPQAKADVFHEFMLKYSTDDASLTAESPYTVGVKTSSMMEDFTKKARMLHDKGVVNGYTDNMSDLAYAERWNENVIDYGGYHIVSYLGEIKNLFEIGDINTFKLSDADIYKLANTRVNPLTNKTYFDVIFDSLNSNKSFAVFENLYIQGLRDNATVERYPDNWKDLLGK